MKKLLLFITLIFVTALNAQQIKKTDIFNDSTLKYLNTQVTYALNLHPALLYNSLLIIENYKNGNLKDAISLFNLTRELYRVDKNYFIDSILYEINELPLIIQKRRKMLSLFEDLKEDTDYDFSDKDISNLKIKFNYDENYNKYYEYCHFIADFKSKYDKNINYSAMLKNSMENNYGSILGNYDNHTSISKEDKKLLIQSLIKKWYLLKELPDVRKPDFIKLIKEIYDEDIYNVNSTIISSVSYYRPSTNYYYKKSQKIQGKDNFMHNNYYTMNINQSNYNLFAGLKIKLRNEETPFSWISVLVGIGFNEASYNYDMESSGLNKEYENVGAKEGMLYFRKYNVKESASNTNNYFCNINFPVYYVTDWFLVGSGVELSYFQASCDYLISMDNYEENIKLNEFSETIHSDIYSFKEEIRDFKISPVVNLNFHLYKNLSLNFSKSLYNFRIGVITGISI